MRAKHLLWWREELCFVRTAAQIASGVLICECVGWGLALSQNGHQRSDWLGRACVCECQSTAYQAIKERMGVSPVAFSIRGSYVSCRIAFRYIS